MPGGQRSGSRSRAATAPPAAVAGSASPAPGNKAQQVQGQPPFAISELDQRPVTAGVAIGAGAAVTASCLGAGPGMAVVWKATVPPGTRNMPLQLARRASGGAETITQDN